MSDRDVYLTCKVDIISDFIEILVWSGCVWVGADFMEEEELFESIYSQ